MIQRIQTLYLAIVAVIAIGLTNVLSFYTIDEKAVKLMNTFSEDSLTIKSVGVFFIVSALLAILAIFKFKNRQNQFVLNRLNIIVNFYLLGVLIYLSLTLPGESVSEKGIGVYFPLVSVVLLVLANKAIKKDEDLVKSVDRIR